MHFGTHQSSEKKKMKKKKKKKRKEKCWFQETPNWAFKAVPLFLCICTSSDGNKVPLHPLSL